MANGNGTKPKLELQVNIPTKIKLLQDKPATGESSYGRWFLYSVACDDTEQSFFAPEQVEKFIEDNQLKKGDELQITKTLTKNGKANVIDFKIELLSKQESKPTNSKDDFEIMRESMKQAIQLQQELGFVIDVNRVGISLYINRSKY